MKRTEAARYARWSAAIAMAIAIFAVAAYLRRDYAERKAQRVAPPPVPANVEQQSSQFSYSKVVGNRTLFSIRASRATEYKDQNRSALQNVLITLYGHNSDRNDTISAQQCGYLPVTGDIQCQGEVQIDLRNARASSTADRGMHLETRDISFDPAKETVSTPNAITLQIAGGSGQATGVVYDTKNETVKFAKDVKLQSGRLGSRRSTPVELYGSSLVYRRNSQILELAGPVTAQQGSAKLLAGALELQLDSQMLPVSVVASRGVKITSPSAQGPVSISAGRVEAILDSLGVLQQVIADGAVHVDQKFHNREQSFSAGHVELAMSNRNGRTQPHELQATGNILAESQEGGVIRRLETASLHMEFSPRENSRDLRILNASAQTPSQFSVVRRGDNDLIRAARCSAEFRPDGSLTKLVGAEGVETTRQTDNKPEQHTYAQNVTALFSGPNNWTTIEEAGDMKFDQGDRSAAANHAMISRATNEIVLDGNARISDSSWSTSAEHIEMNQISGEVHAIGSVVSTYSGAPGTHPITLGTGPAHVSADRLDGSKSHGIESYTGHARLWQTGAVLDSDKMEVWPDEKKLHARGNIHAVIPEAPSSSQQNATPILWRVTATDLEYSGTTGELNLTGGARADSSTGSLSGQAIQFLFAPDARNQQRLQRAIIDGGVKIQSNGHVGTAERGEYTSQGGKFVLSGGQPRLSDTLGNITTGRELTFFLASDTILVDSQKGSRTVTKHRVEK